MYADGRSSDDVMVDRYNRNIMPQPPYHSFKDLQATSTGNVLTAAELNGGNGSRSVHDLILDVTTPHLQRLEACRAATPSSAFLNYIREHAAGAVGLRVPNVNPGAEEAGRLGGALVLGPAPTPARSVIIDGEGRCKIEIEFFYPPSSPSVPKAAKGALIFLVQPDPQSQTLLNAEQLHHVEFLASEGFVVAAPILCGFGDRDPFGKSKPPPLATENLLESTDWVLRPHPNPPHPPPHPISVPSGQHPATFY